MTDENNAKNGLARIAHNTVYVRIKKEISDLKVANFIPDYTDLWLGNPSSELFSTGVIQTWHLDNDSGERETYERMNDSYVDMLSGIPCKVEISKQVREHEGFYHIQFGYDTRGGPDNQKQRNNDYPSMISFVENMSSKHITFKWTDNHGYWLRHTGPVSIDLTYTQKDRTLLPKITCMYALNEKRVEKQDFVRWYEMVHCAPYLGI